MKEHGRITVLVADDEWHIRSALTDLIEGEPSLRLVAAAPDGTEAVRAAERHRPMVAIVDVRMPDGGADAVRAIAAVSPSTAVVAYSAHSDAITKRDMLAAGARWFVAKGAPAAELLEAIADAGGGDGGGRGPA